MTRRAETKPRAKYTKRPEGQTLAEYMKLRRDLRKADGICIDCSRPRDPRSNLRCKACLKMAQQASRRYNLKRKYDY